MNEHDPGGYLDTSNPLRLKAFFAYTDAANMASKPIEITEPLAHACVAAIMDSMRQRAAQAALDLLAPCR